MARLIAGETAQLTVKDQDGVPVDAADVNFTSSSDAIATVDAEGVVTGNAGGEVTITATLKDNAEVSNTVTLTVVELPNGRKTAQWLASEQGFGDYEQPTSSTITDGYTVAFGASGNLKPYYSDFTGQMYLQNGTSLTIAGENIVEIVITYGAYPLVLSASEGTLVRNNANSTYTWTGLSNSVTFTHGSDTGRLIGIDVTYALTVNEPETVELRGKFNGWNANKNVLTKVAGADYVYEGTLDLTNDPTNQDFKLLIDNGGQDNKGWIGYGKVGSDLTLDTPDNWIVDDNGNDHNLLLKNIEIDYATYLVTATWDAGEDPYTGWTLKVEGVTPREPVYSVTGQSPGGWGGKADPLFGTGWDSTIEANELQKSADADNLYTWTKEGVELSAGNIDFKVIKYHRYAGEQGGLEWPSSNYVKAVEEAGTYDVTITFNSTTGEITIDLTEQVVEKSFFATFVNTDGWTDLHVYGYDSNGEVTAAWPGDELEATGETLDVFDSTFDTYSFGFVSEPTDIIITGYKDNELKRTNPDGQGGMPFVKDALYSVDGYASGVTGRLLFTDDENQFKPEDYVNISDQKVLVSYARKFVKDRMSTVVLPVNLPAYFADANNSACVGSFYELTAYEDGILKFTDKADGFIGYKPYAFLPNADGYLLTNIPAAQLTKATVNATQVGEATMTFFTEETDLHSDATTTYYGFDSADGTFVKASYAIAPAFRAFITVPTSAAKYDTLLLNFGGNDAGNDDAVVDGISSLRAAIADGTAQVYDLQGRRVVNPSARGIYIVNGTKIVVK